jgi:hypothetical protein
MNSPSFLFDLTGFDFLLAMCQARLGAMFKARNHFRRAVRWVEAPKDLPAPSSAELKALQAKAEALLRRAKP